MSFPGYEVFGTFLSALRGTGESGLTDVVPFVYLLFLAWLVLAGPGAASLDALLVRALQRTAREPRGETVEQPA